MAQTQIPSGHALSVKEYSVALFAHTLRNPSLMKNITGPTPKMGEVDRKLKNQTMPGMPCVRVTDLSKSAGDTVSVDCVDVMTGKPIMGDRNAEGKGEKLTFSSMDVKIDLATKVVDVGGRMTQQRTRHGLRQLALANLGGYMPRLESQLCLIHLAGARGTQSGFSWAVPLTSDADYAEIVVNSVKAPTYNRHFVVSGSTLVQGGAQLGSVASTDALALTHIDQIRTFIDDLEFRPQPVQVADDPAAADEPMYVLLVTPRVYSTLVTSTASSNIRSFQQNAWNRASYGSKHPLFKGEVGMWNGILVKKIDYAIRFLPSDATNIITAANRYTATETSQTVNGSLTAGYAVERSILLGAQALANVYGRNQSSDYYYSWLEHWYNFHRHLEIAAEMMGGKAKLRFNVPDSAGTLEPTDHGVLIIDSVVKL
jgi:N4-gp56 family major capsid protein